MVILFLWFVKWLMSLEHWGTSGMDPVEEGKKPSDEISKLSWEICACRPEDRRTWDTTSTSDWKGSRATMDKRFKID